MKIKLKENEKLLEKNGRKYILSTRKNGTQRIQHILDPISKTDQSDKNMTDINVIMKNYLKTGVLPNFKQKVAQYIDTTQIPSYMEAHEQITRANELFRALPSEVRKLMNNDPSQLEQVIKNPNYREVLEKHGILKKKITQAKSVEHSDGQAKPAAQAKKTNDDDKKSE